MKAKQEYCQAAEPFPWQDGAWLRFRQPLGDFAEEGTLPIPLNIYEVHLETFHEANGAESVSFHHGADMLAPYAKHMGYTHIELFGVMDLPSMIPAVYLGGEKDFCHLVDKAHRVGLGVLIRVPLIFKNDYNDALGAYYLNALLRWIESYHIDGIHIKTEISLGVDEHMVRRSIEGIVSAIRKAHPDVLLMDEGLKDASLPPELGGLGYHLEWCSTWRSALADYLALGACDRKNQHKKLISAIDSHRERGVLLPLSHSFVAKGSKSLLQKAEGSYEEKFSQFKTAFMLNMTRPGKKLMFMGNEYGPFTEWDRSNPLEWYMLDFPAHRAVREYVAAFNRFYLTAPELWELDEMPEGFEWIYPYEAEKNLVAYKRYDKKGSVLYIVLSFSTESVTEWLPAKEGYRYEFVFETANNGEPKPPVYPTVCQEDPSGRGIGQGSICQMLLALPRMAGLILRECEDSHKII